MLVKITSDIALNNALGLHLIKSPLTLIKITSDIALNSIQQIISIGIGLHNIYTNKKIIRYSTK